MLRSKSCFDSFDASENRRDSFEARDYKTRLSLAVEAAEAKAKLKARSCSASVVIAVVAAVVVGPALDSDS